MSGECNKCGEHTLECICDEMDKRLFKLTIRQMAISEKIQSQLALIITEYLDEKPSLIDALDWILAVILNDECNELDVYDNSWRNSKKTQICSDKMIFSETNFYLNPEMKMVDGDEDLYGGYICRLCAIKFGAIPPRDHVCTWHLDICDFCLEEANLCHTTDWNWPDNPEIAYGREL